MAYISLKFSNKPDDDQHQFGHGKFEDLSAFLEAGLIIFVAIGVIYKAFTGTETSIHHLELGIGVMFMSIIVNGLVSKYLTNVAHEHDSVALHADAWHLSADVLTSFGVLIGLCLVKLTGFQLFDPFAAVLVSSYIIIEAFHIGKTGCDNLLDTSLPEHEQNEIKKLIKYPFKTRKSGHERHIYVSIPNNISTENLKQLEDNITKVNELFNGSRITVQFDFIAETDDIVSAFAISRKSFS